MSESEVLLDLWRRSCRGDPWYGPSLEALLRDVGAEAAAARPMGQAHSIWEIVLHVTGWTGEVAHRLQGRAPAQPEGGDWPEPGEPTDRRWKACLDALEAAQAHLESALTALAPERLAERVGSLRDAPLGTGVSYGAMVSGLLQHNAYHGGQIALLKRALAPR